MVPIFPSTALKNKQREIKALADTQMVHITENGHGKYIFASEDVIEKAITDAVEDALYEARMASALSASRRDFEEGRFYESRSALMEGVAKKRTTHA